VRSLPRLDAYAILICALFGMSLLAMRDSSSGTSEGRATPAPLVSQDTAQFKVISTSGVPVPIPSDPPPADVAAPAAIEPIPVASPSPIAAADGLVLTLTARRTCWVGTTIDGGQRLERILQPDETVMVHAHDEVVLRVGDATAISVLINNQPMKALGASGQVVTSRISRANYLNLLAP
jgi:hypothetical protein